MLEKLGYKIKEFLKILFIFKPEESFKEIFESLNYLDEELGNIYYSSFELESLFEYYVNKNRLKEIEEEIKKYNDVVEEIVKDNENLSNKVSANLMVASFLTVASLISATISLHPFILLMIFYAAFFVSYRLAYVSSKLDAVNKKDSKSQREVLGTLERMTITCGNVSRNLAKRRPLIEAKVTSKIVEIDIWEKAQEALNNYLDNGTLTAMSDEVMIYLKEMLEQDLGVEEDNIFTLLELAKAKDSENKNVTLEKNLT